MTNNEDKLQDWFGRTSVSYALWEILLTQDLNYKGC